MMLCDKDKISEVAPAPLSERVRIYSEWDYTDDHIFAVQPPPDKRLWLEVGSGNGHFIWRCAECYPDIAWVAIEQKKKRIDRLCRKLERTPSASVDIIYGDFFTLARGKLIPASFERIFVNFPDPWPKKRHGKYRLIAPERASLFHGLLVKGGIFSLATDSPLVAAGARETFVPAHGFIPLSDADIVPSRRSMPATLYQEKWLEVGRDLYFMEFRAVDVEIRKGFADQPET